MTLLPGPVPIACLGPAPHNCLSIATYPVPPGPPQPGLPLPGGNQQVRAEKALLRLSAGTGAGMGPDLGAPGTDAVCFIPAAASQQAAPQGLPGTPTCKICPQHLKMPGGSSEGLQRPAASTPNLKHFNTTKSPYCPPLPREPQPLLRTRSSPS